MSTFLAFLLALASSFMSTEAPARAHARPETRGTLTEVHFFKADDHTRAIAKYSITAPVVGSTTAHGSYARLRVGPRDLAKAERDRMNPARPGAGDSRVLREGDDITVFAINHATGHAGMQTITVPDFADDSARITDLVEIVGDIKLFPPEIEVTVERQLKSAGVAAPTAPSKIRGGGAATTGDEWLKIGSRWRVRLAPPRHDDYVDGGSTARAPGSPIRASWGEGRTTADLLSVDAGQLETDTSDAGFIDGGPAAQEGVTALVDEGKRAAPLERLCSELDENATPREYLDCLNDETTLTDVPAGIPPIAGRIVHLSGAASTDQLFHIEGGAHEQALHVARKTTTSTTLPIQTGLHLLHVVGRPLSGNADTNNDGELSQEEREAGSDCSDVTNADGSTSRRCTARIMASDEVLLQGAPDFRDDVTMRGFPKQAVAVKALYDARLQAESSGAARKVASYDTTREHRFRVLSLEETRVEGGNADSSRELEQDDTTAHADEGDAWFGLFTNVVDSGGVELADRGLDTPGEFELRLGGDAIGIECSLTVNENGSDQRALEGMCEGQSLDEVISALDIVYIELFESGNSDNVLYRYNLYGTHQRIDHAAVNSGWNGRKSVEAKALATPHKRPMKAAVSEPNVSFFYLDPDDIVRGIVKVCQAADCSAPNDPLKDLDVRGYAPETGYDLFDRVSSKQKLPLVDGPAELTGTRWYKLVLPPEMTKMDGVDDASGIPYFVNYEAIEPAGQSSQLKFKTPEGRSESIGTMSPGHTLVANVDVADGRLLRSYPDIVLPEKSTSRSFVRFYNNQMNALTPLGVGWTHNLDAYILEEVPGRHVVVFDGQARVFQECTVAVNGEEPDTRKITSVTSCVTDRTHGGLLELTATSDDGGNTWNEFSAELSTEDGVVVRFDRLSQRYDSLGRRRYLATWIDDGLKEKLWFKYDNDLVTEVTRAPALTSPTPTGLTFTLAYEDIADAPRNSARVVAAQELGVKRLIAVTATLPNNTIVAEVKFDHDTTKARGANDGTVGPQCGELAAAVGEKDHMNLTRACRFTRATTASTTRREDLRWEYAYDAPRGKGLQWNVSANELKTEKMKLPLVLDTPTSSSLVYEASYKRNSDLKYQHPYDQVNGVEAIHGATVQGETYAFAYDGTNRDITFPVGGKKASKLNEFGNVDQLNTPCGVVVTDSESKNDTGRAVPISTKDEEGFEWGATFDERNRPKGSKLLARPTTDMKQPVGYVVGTGVIVDAIDERFGSPTIMRVPEPNGGSGTVTVTTTYNARGAAISGSFGRLSWSRTVDEDGRPALGVGATETSGHVVTVEAYDPEFGLPTRERRECTLCGDTAADYSNNLVTINKQSLTRTTYDALGRVGEVVQEPQGHVSKFEYDAIGRVVKTVTSADDDDATQHFGDIEHQTAFKQSGDEVTTTETVIRRDTATAAQGTITTVTRRGLVRRTTDEGGVSAVTTYDTNECRPLKVVSSGDTKVSTVEYVPSTIANAVKRVAMYEQSSAGAPRALVSDVELDEQGRIVGRTTVADESFESLTYSAAGLLLRHEYGDGHKIRYGYDSEGRLTLKVSDGSTAEKAKLDVRYSNFQQPLLPGRVTTRGKGVEDLTYDVFGNVVLSDVLVNGYKFLGPPTTEGGRVTPKPLHRTTLTQFGYSTRSTSNVHYGIESPLGGIKTRTVLTVFEPDGRTRSMTDATGTLSHVYERDARGMVWKTTSTMTPTNGSATIMITELGDDLSESYETSSLATDATRRPLEVLEFYPGGQLRRRIAPDRLVVNSMETFRRYDAPHPRETETQGFDGARTTVVTREFDDTGRPLVEQTNIGTSITRVVSSYVDAADRTSLTRTVEMNSAGTTGTLDALLDGNGRLVESLATLSNGDTRTMLALYDAGGGLVTTTLPSLEPPLVYNDGRPWMVTNLDGGRTVYGYFLDDAVEKRTVIPVEVWSTRGCVDPTDPPDPDLVATMITQGEVGRANAALQELMDNRIDGVVRCDLLGVVKMAFEASGRFLQSMRDGVQEIYVQASIELASAAIGPLVERGVAALAERLAARTASRRALSGEARIGLKSGFCRIASCFVAGTAVMTSTGMKPIERIEVGDQVWSKDPWTGAQDWSSVVDTKRQAQKSIIDIELTDEDEIVDVISSTADHPFFVVNKGFTEAVHLAVGDHVETAAGDTLTVASTTWRGTAEDVFNLEVEGAHTFYAGNAGVWVHNGPDSCSPAILRERIGNFIRDDLGESLDSVEFFLHGTTTARAAGLQVEAGRRLFTAVDPSVALHFGRRSVSREGGDLGLALLVLPRSEAAALRRAGLLRVKPIDDIPGAREFIFEPGAAATLSRFGIIEDVSRLLR